MRFFLLQNCRYDYVIVTAK